ncbi:hypothetical protein HDC90_001093 [Pedobacter sp. AK013]|uniref:hypothetical protein n=1 Tax=Pedobacter sp. AK013 TaxID=2723071 RepID=UPI0016119268|nr:hypothetical protein [Pedobacter sp. AK013]MBB6236481.1 hypothetical protein [Pedobacter sp. AK013]
MSSLSRFKSALVEKGRRILKVIEYGPKTADECAPFGDDSNPLANMTAVLMETDVIGEPVVVGYLNTNQLAASGEKRIYSLKPDGSVSFYAWLKNDGTMHLGGYTHNLVRYAPLNTSINNQNTEINAELTKIAAAITLLGGAYSVSPVSIDISGSKINEIKTL